MLLANLKDHTYLFSKVPFRKGRGTAVSANARKLGVILSNMITKKISYNPPAEYLFPDQKRKLGSAQNIKRNILNLKSNLKTLDS